MNRNHMALAVCLLLLVATLLFAPWKYQTQFIHYPSSMDGRSGSGGVVCIPRHTRYLPIWSSFPKPPHPTLDYETVLFLDFIIVTLTTATIVALARRRESTAERGEEAQSERDGGESSPHA